MAKTPLRVFGSWRGVAQTSAEPTVRLKLRDLFPLLLHAHRHDHAWLSDLSADDVLVTEDLAEVLRHFAKLIEERKPA